MQYSYDMGFAINGVPIPDPTAFSGADSALDTLGKRDANGNLHRKMVAIKHPTKVEYTNYGWDMIKHIMQLMIGEEFQFTYPDPRLGMRTMKAYAGDREWECVRFPSDGQKIGTLKVSLIEF